MTNLNNILYLLTPENLLHTGFELADRWYRQHILGIILVALYTLVIDTNMGQAGIGTIHQAQVSNYRPIPPNTVIAQPQMLFLFLNHHLNRPTLQISANDFLRRQTHIIRDQSNHGTVGPELVKEAAKEAVQGMGFDLLLICGFAFDPHVAEEAKRYGNLTILPTRINADLQLGSEFLKKTGSGNLFMVFGEPDLKVTKTKDKKIEVEIKGLDIYDPTTGEIRSNSTDDIACWFIDTNYNEESFFVRHAYFTGGDTPYEKLQRTLRAEINEDAWFMLYTTKSRSFDKPATGKIAVKIINHYGDEVLKVYDIK